jgi:hypothetical protein
MWADENTTIEFKGLAGRALDPEPYYVPIMENISAGTSIPLAILRGAQAGQLAGSEVNEREYFKLISDCQSRYEPGIMDLIDRLMETKQIPDVHYKINWLGGFEINPRNQAAAELDKSRSLELKTNWMTVNEIRQLEGLDPIPGVKYSSALLQGKIHCKGSYGEKFAAAENLWRSASSHMLWIKRVQIQGLLFLLYDNVA